MENREFLNWMVQINKLDKKQIKEGFTALKRKWSDLSTVEEVAAKASLGLRVGLPVSFRHNGRDLEGTVKSVNVKTATVDIGSGRCWKVPFSYLVVLG